MRITTYRNLFNPNSTGGVTVVDGIRFCHSQEDAARAHGVKIPGQTCIPPFVYKVGIWHSLSFGRPMLILYTEDDGYTLKAGGISFTHIYHHGGNRAADTLGCILGAKNRGSSDEIWGTQEKELFKKVSPLILAGEEVIWEVVNDPNNQHKFKWERG